MLKSGASFAAISGITLLAPVGYWLGEHLSPLASTAPVVVLGLLFLTCWLSRHNGIPFVLFLGLVGAFTAGFSWFAGRQSASLAFNECVTSGETVRQQLASFRQLNGRYPGALGELGVNLPCRLLLPPQLLQYATTASGYSLRFQDWLVVHTASESEPFDAHK